MRWYNSTKHAKSHGKRTFAGQCRYARIIGVYDGDTITVLTKLDKNEKFREYSVRILGVDTPEIRTTDPLHKQAGLAVRDRLCELLPVGSMVMIDFFPEDKYGRLLGNVYVVRRGLWYNKRGTNIADWLINHQLGLPYDGGKKTEFTCAFLESIVSI